MSRPASPPPDVPDAAARRCDVLVVGGGINGAGIARDLAGRGLKVLLCEQDDLAAHTSSSSTKLIHGGLRYLEHYEFALVRKALAEREVLLRSAPHIMWPLRFVMPHDPAMRPVWMIRLGLFLYDHLARRELLPASETVDLRGHPAGRPLQPRFTRGFVYSDGWVDDARLVVLNAVDAATRGALVRTRCRCTEARRHGDEWRVRLQPADGPEETWQARAVVNAAGPWAARFLAEQAGRPRPKALRLVKGSHLVIRRRLGHDLAYIFQNPDKRIIFAIPYEGDFTLVGTTDVEVRDLAAGARIDDAEIDYLCAQASRYLAQPVTRADVVWTYSGVRPLLEDEAADASAVTRDYQLETDADGAPLLSVWGGKITTFRRLAEEAADTLCRLLGERRPAWTEHALLPGGDLGGWIGAPQRPDADIERFRHALRVRHPELGEALVQRWSRSYGALVDRVLADGLGEEVVPDLHEGELRYLRRHEWARSVDDVLWRRTKLGLHLDASQQAALADWWQRHPLDLPAAAGAVTETTWN